MISIAVAMMPCPIKSDTTLQASSIVSNTARRVFTASGFGSSRTTTLVTMPSVPSEPTITPVRS